MVTISTLGSHSALDVCRGATDEGFKTLVVCEKEREQTYTRYFKSHGKLGCVDECIVLEKFEDILKPSVQKILQKKKAIFIPNRSFEAYLHFNYEKIEKEFTIPIFGNKYLLKIEERGRTPNQYTLLQEARIRIPKQFKNSADIDRLCLVKVSEKLRPFERAFFLVESSKEFLRKSQQLIESGKITKQSLQNAVIEEFVLGAQVNFNFFYSPLSQRLELLGTDTRRQTNLDGLLRIPGNLHESVLSYSPVTYEEAGHIAVTVLESLLEKAFELGEAFVKTSQKLVSPGITGPFALQSIITSGPPKKDIVVIDVSPRMPGSPGISATPYSSYLFGKPVSVGRRVAMEIKQAIEKNELSKIIT